MNIVYISLGSNLGDRKLILELSLERLNTISNLKSVSSLFESEPWGYKDQGNFLNAVAEIETSLSSRELLKLLKDIERDFGRDSSELRWGPRNLDLDILLYNSDIVNEEDLKIPHPELKNRSFQLIPLLELNPELKDPTSGGSLKLELKNIKEDKIKKIAVFNRGNLCWDEDI